MQCAHARTHEKMKKAENAQTQGGVEGGGPLLAFNLLKERRVFHPFHAADELRREN